MAIGAGIGGFVAMKAESTYGTFPGSFDHYIEPQSSKIVRNQKPMVSSGIANGRLVDLSSRRVIGTNDATGPMVLEVPRNKFGQILNAAISGGTITPVQQGGSAAYLQTHPLGDIVGKSYSIQQGIPDTTGTIRPYTAQGAKVTAFELACAIDGFLEATVTWDAQQLSEAPSAATPSYSNQIPWSFDDCTISAGAFGSEATVLGVKKFTLKVERKMNVGRYYFSNAGLKSEPITNDTVPITGTLDYDFLDKTVFLDHFPANTPISLIFNFVGPIIASTFHYTMAIALPAVFIDGPSPDLSNMDIVSPTLNFVALYDGTNNACTVTYTSTDVTL